MADLYITEFKDVGYVSARQQAVMVGALPPVATQKVASYTTSKQSSAFDSDTRFIRVIANADAFIEVGSDPTATATSTKLEADVAEYFAVHQDGVGPDKLAVYDGSS